MKLGDLLKNVDIVTVNADLNAEIGGVYTDSRRKPNGENALFIAVRGYEFDGHDYIGAAVQNGASCVLCEKAPDVEIPYVLCADTRKAQSTVTANYFGRPADSMKIIGVTGTKGKTIVTHLIKFIIEDITGKPAGLIGTLYNKIGGEILETESVTPTTPDAFDLHRMFAQMRDAGCEYAVMEVSSIALTLERVADVTFEVGVCTNIAHDHLDYHGTMEEYARAKARLFKQSRFAVINGDDAYAQMLRDNADCPVFAFSSDDMKCDLISKRVKLMPDKVEFCALTLGNIQQIELNIPGMFSVYNAMAAVSVCLRLGFDIDAISDAMARCPSVTGRMETVPDTDGFTVIIDYAHTPESLRGVLETVRGSTNGRVITLFGCGGDRDRTKRPLMGKIAVELSDAVYLTSDNPRTEEPDAIIAEILEGMQDTLTPITMITDRRAAIYTAIANAQQGDTLILAGKGQETYQISGKNKYPFDEREIVAEAMRLRGDKK